MIRTLVLMLGVFSLAATDASAVTITSFNKTTNDGVYTLSAAQVTTLGYDPTDVDRIGFFRVRKGGGTTFAAGDTFDAGSVYASTNNDDKIKAILNGTNAELTYSGNAFSPLGETIVGEGKSFYKGVAFLFHSKDGNIVFNGTSTFDPSRTEGEFDGIPAVPLPAAAWLFGSALLGMAGVGYRRRAQAA